MTSNPFAAQGPTHRLGTNDWLRLQERARKTYRAERDLPRLVGDEGSPVEFSTCLAVDTTPRFIWDTNGFYRRLGVTPEASRQEIAHAAIHALVYAFQTGDTALEKRLDRAARTLLHRGYRRKYDATPLGAFWADDPDLVRPELLLDDESDLTPVEGWPWAYYVVSLDESDIDHECMAEWRALICLAFAGEAQMLALGIAPGADIAVMEIGFRTAILVGIALKPSWEYALTIAAALGSPDLHD